MKLLNIFKIQSQKTEKMRLGELGEKEALKYLLKEGYELLEKNFRFSHSEIDLILKDGECIVFCEVRTQSLKKSHYLTPAESISENKKASLSRGASFYLSKYSITSPSRFDIVEVYTENNKLLKDAFYKMHKTKKGTGYKLCRR